MLTSACANHAMPPAADSSALPVDEETPPGPARQSLCLGVSEQEGPWADVSSLDLAIRRVGEALARHPAGARVRCRQATVVLGSDALVGRLNATYRGKAAATNVLSFPFTPRAARADQEANRYLGDVVLAAETIAREAAERRIEPIHHVQHLVLHGLLHLIGYDHASEAEAVQMEQLETEILTRLGLKDPYAASPPSQH
jgi:probable rRNA maturation factor